MDVLQGLDTFLILALKGSITATASELGIPRSTVSRRLSRLEEELGVTLVERNTRHLRLTDAGQILTERGRPLVAELRALRADMRHLSGAIQGTLRISAPVGLGVDFLTAFLSQLRARAPLLRPELLVRDGVPDLLAERIDIAFAEGPLADLPWYDYVVSDAQQVVVLSPAYAVRLGEPTAPGELGAHECLGLESARNPAHQWPLREGGVVEIDPILVANDMQLLREGALAGLGIALLPTYAVALDILAGRLRTVLPEVGRPANLHALTTRKRSESAKLDVFFSLLEDFSAEITARHAAETGQP